MSDPDQVIVRPPTERPRSRVWLLLPLVVTLVIVAAAAGYWVVKVHQRAGLGKVTAAVQAAEPGASVRCVSLQQNASSWACAAVWRAESECMVAGVSVLGNVSVSVGHHRCIHITALTQRLPTQITPAAVDADAARLLHVGAARCAGLHGTHTRWACVVSGPSGKECRTVRVISWAPWKFADGGSTCSHVPALRKA